MLLFDKEEWKKINSNRRGDIAELTACNWLLMQGYEVFRNVCSAGPADLVAFKKGEEPILIDVSVIYWGNNCIGDSKKLNVDYYNKGIAILYLMPNGECKWREDIENFQSEIRQCSVCQVEFTVKKHSNKRKCDAHRTKV